MYYLAAGVFHGFFYFLYSWEAEVTGPAISIRAPVLEVSEAVSEDSEAVDPGEAVLEDSAEA